MQIKSASHGKSYGKDISVDMITLPEIGGVQLLKFLKIMSLTLQEFCPFVSKAACLKAHLVQVMKKDNFKIVLFHNILNISNIQIQKDRNFSLKSLASLNKMALLCGVK